MELMLCHFSPTQLLATPWTVARQAPLSMGFSRQEYWSGLSCPTATHGTNVMLNKCQLFLTY